MLYRIASEPWSFFGGILVWLPLAVWIVSLIGWMISGEIDSLVGFMGILLAIGLGALTMSPPDPRLSPVILGSVILTTLLFPTVQQVFVVRAHRSIDADVMERAYSSLRAMPANIGSEIKIASVIYDRGLPGQAIAIVERVLARAPQGVFEEERRMLSTWKARTPAQRLAQSIMCAACGASNPPGPVFCTRCGAPFLLDFMRGRLVAGGLAAKLVGSWLAAVAATVGIAWAGIRLPPGPAIAAMSAIAAGLVVAIWAIFRSQERAM